jgi:ABC-type methionine transport system ATPase subunit
MAKMRVHLTFPPERIKEPVIYQLGREFGLVTNIRRADVTATHGWVTLEIEGKDDDLERGVAWLKKQGLKVDPIEGDVIAP